MKSSGNSLVDNYHLRARVIMYVKASLIHMKSQIASVSLRVAQLELPVLNIVLQVNCTCIMVLAVIFAGERMP